MAFVRIGFVSLLLVLAFVPPAGAAAWSGSEAVRDGVLWIENPATGMLPAETLTLQEVWRIGGDSEADEEFFGVIGDIAIDAKKNIYILDSQLSEIRVFDQGGSFLRSIGREGEGPGEFRRPNDLFFLPDGRLGVIQPFPSKIVLFDAAGNPAGDFPFEGTGASGGFVALTGGARAGSDLALLYSAGKPAEGSFSRTVTLARVGADGKTKAVVRQAESRMDYASSNLVEKDWNLFERCWTAAPDGRLFARDGYTDYRIAAYGPDGKLARMIERDYAPHARKSADIERIKSVWGRMIGRWVQNPSFAIEPNWNPVEDIHAREDGSLWVRTSRGARDLPAGVMAKFDVFDTDGRYVREIAFRGAFDPENDGIFLNEEFILVVTDLISARSAMMGGADGDEEEDEEATPMEVICYRIDLGAVAGK